MFKKILFILAITFFSLAPLLSSAQEWKSPYGVCCVLEGGEYGICPKPLNHEQARRVLKAYFERHGLRINNFTDKGRFIEADVFRGNELIDKVLLDRKTGRMRSIQ
ncbi:MAG: hypothetical protein HZC12_06440 [Nitrospirae bacterium]|nr:hypothetical protein [Nitrospirota bacterium]